VAFVERAAQLARLEHLFDECLASRGSTAVISGGVASGKTELLRVFTAKAAAAGATVLEAAASPTERELPGGVLGQLFRSPPLPEPDGELIAKLLSDDAFIWPRDPEAEGLGRLRTQVILDVWAPLRALSECAPIVIAVDDLHVADEASRQCLLYLASRLDSARVLMVVTASDQEPDGRQATWHTDLPRQARWNRVRLAPLSRDGVGEILAEEIGQRAAGSLTGGLHRLSGGNPLLVLALLEDLGAVGETSAPPDPDAVPGEAYQAALLTCLRRVDPRFLEVARALAVLEESGASASLHRMLEADDPSANRVLGALGAAGLLAAGRFRHPAARAAVLDDMPASLRVRLHRSAADVLHGAGAAETQIATHLVGAQQVDQPWALDILLRAADEAILHDRVHHAAKYLRLAAQACTDDQQRLAVTLAQSRAECRINPGAAMRYLTPLTAALRAGQLTVHQAVALIRPMLLFGREDEAKDVFDLFCGAAVDLDAAAVADLHTTAEWVRSFQPPLAARLTGLPARSPSDVATAAAGPLAQGAATLGEVLRGGGSEASVNTAEWVLQATRLDDATMWSLESALTTLIYSGRIDVASFWCETLAREADVRHAPAWQAMFAGIQAEIALRRGDPRRAERHTRAALALIPAWSWGVMIGGPLSCLLLSTTATGREAEVEPILPAVPDAIFQTRFGPQYLYARGHQRLARNWLHAALDDLLTCGRLMTEWDIDVPGFVPWRVDAAEAQLRLGRVAQARALVREHLSRPGGDQLRVRGMTRRIQAAVGEPRERPALLREAVDVLVDSGDRLQLAYALADLSRAHRLLGDAGKARTVALRADRIARECDADPLRRRLAAAQFGDEPEVARPVVSPDGAAALSAAERQVATLAASGRTNREIASKLYITVSTVEQHLTRAYRKLRVNGRADLPVSLDA
jgi:DNA-binding CsgD family transcriptional regulator